MKRLILVAALMLALGQSGCAFLGGAAAGALGSSAGYEYNAYNQMNKLDEDLKAERISRKEYESRKAQIEAGSILY